MNNQEKMVLTCIDGSSVATAVCDYATWISQKSSAPLMLLHTIEHAITPPVSDLSGAIGLGSREDLLEEIIEVEQSRNRLLIEKGQHMLQGAKDRVSQSGIHDAELCQRHGTLVESLIELEEKTQVLVMGIRGESHDSQNTGIGTQLESVIRALHKPILVVNNAFRQPRQVMLAYDGSTACGKALDMVATSPLFKDITCHIVHVGHGAESMLEEAAAILSKAQIEVTTTQLSGKTDEAALVAYQNSHDIDLMLMGAFTHNRVRDLLLGSFTAKMLAMTNRPLLLVR